MSVVLIPRHKKNGSIPHYLTGYSLGDNDYELKPVEDFHAILQLTHVTSGRSAVTFWWQDTISGATYPMIQSEFNRLIKQAEWQGPLLIDGLWRPCKRGGNYQIKAVLPEDLK